MSSTVKQEEQQLQLRLAKKVLFEKLEIECYEDATRDNGDFFMTRKQISDALEYEDSKSFDKVIERKRNKIGTPVHDKLSGTDGKHYNTELYSFEQLFEIMDGSRQPKAELFRKFAVRTLKELLTGRAELKFKDTRDMFNYKTDMQNMFEEYGNHMLETIKSDVIEPLNNKIISLESHILNNNKTLDMANNQNELLQTKFNKLQEVVANIDNKLKISYNKSAKFEKLKIDFLSAIKYSDTTSYTKFYKELQNWFGYSFPYSTNTKQWILKNINIDIIEEFVNGVVIGTIVKNKKDNWIDLSGVYENQVEFEKVKIEFDNRCAYCGVATDKLDIEHIFCQSNPHSSDIIHNILCACKSCNQSKYNNDIAKWYKGQSFYNDERFENIQKHWKEYHIDKVQ